MDLDAAEEKMLRAIVQSAVIAAAAGQPFAGEFHRFAVRASCLHVDQHGVAEVGATICRRGILLARVSCNVSPYELRMPARVPSTGHGVGQSC
jgi:hypothetical protein